MGNEALGEIDLVDVARRDVFLCGGNDGLEITPGVIGLPFPEGRRGGKRLCDETVGEFLAADFMPFFGIVGVEEEIAIEAKPEGAIVVDTADPGSERKTGVRAFGESCLVACGKCFEIVAVGEISPLDFLGIGGDEGVGRVGSLRKVAGGVEEDRMREMPEAMEDFQRRGLPGEGSEDG